MVFCHQMPGKFLTRTEFLKIIKAAIPARGLLHLCSQDLNNIVTMYEIAFNLTLKIGFHWDI